MKITASEVQVGDRIKLAGEWLLVTSVNDKLRVATLPNHNVYDNWPVRHILTTNFGIARFPEEIVKVRRGDNEETK